MIARIAVIALFLGSVNIVPESALGETGRFERELSGKGWRLWLDRDADWKNDDIHLPPVDIGSLPVNQPSCGWDRMDTVPTKTVAVPGTVEEHFWGANGNPIGTAGDYRGVSWWSTAFPLDASLAGKRIVIAFRSVNLRAEVFVNHRLVGYDVIGNTPFEVGATGAVVFGGENRLDVRITDPVGNFNWNDNDVYRWGSHDVPAVHGFGGITGRVLLIATDAVHIDDIYVENKPDPSEAEVFVTIGNSSASARSGTVTVAIREFGNPPAVVWKKSLKTTVPPDGKELSLYVKGIKPKLWNVRDPHLYVASVEFGSDDGAVADTASRRFGFRYFTVGEKNGDKRFYLNGRRVFLFCAKTRGYWPKNGIFPTPEMAKREIEAMSLFGYNTMLFHRAVGQSEIIEACDEAGYLTYEEPGGYHCLPAATQRQEPRQGSSRYDCAGA